MISKIFRFRALFNRCFHLAYIIPFVLTSCTKSDVPKPPNVDSLFILNSISIYQGSGDSTTFHNLNRNTYSFDSVKNQLTQTILDSTVNGGFVQTRQIIYQYSSNNQLQAIYFSNSGYPYQEMAFQYNANGDLEKAIYSGFNGESVENDFSTSYENGSKIINQYDTISYSPYGPFSARYTFNAAGKLIDQLFISSTELSTGWVYPYYPFETSFEYDGNNHATQIKTNLLENSDGTADDTMQIARDISTTSPMNDLASFTLRNLSWLITIESLEIFPYGSLPQYAYSNREIPLKSTYETRQANSYKSSYQNSYDTNGLLTKSSITTVEYNNTSGQSFYTNEVRYYTYQKVTK
jgi:hypothetical protein